MRHCLIYLFVITASVLVPPSGATGLAAVDGITEPFMDVTLGLADPGIVRQLFFKEGEFVQKGGAILELDKSLEELEVQRRKAEMEQNKMVRDSTRALIESTKAVSKEDLAKAEAGYAVSAAEHGIAVQQLANRRLVAPFSGNITEILLRPGAACAPYQSLVRLVDVSRCYFTGHMDGVAVSSLKLDQPVKIEVTGGRSVTGKICFISPVVDPASGLARVKAIFDNMDAKIRPGLAARMVIE